MTPKKVKEFFARLQKQNPEPKGELEYTNPYTLLVAVVLSAQATDTSVNKATRALFNIVKTPEDMLKLGETGLKEHIKTIGLYNGKAKNIIALSRQLIGKHRSSVPESRGELVKLPGVGRKTANVILNTAFGHPTIGVDTHIFRLANRTGLAPGKNVRIVEEKLQKAVPESYKKDAHHWLILHGRYVCKSRKPACPACIVRDLCGFKEKTVQ